LTSLSFQSTINIGNDAQPITFTAEATDDLSGVDQVNIWFTRSLNYGFPNSTVTGNSTLLVVYDSHDSFSDGQSSYTYTITPFNAGTYTIDHVDVVDKAANVHTYNTTQLTAIGAQTSFTVQEDHSPTITSNGGGDSASIAVPENSTVVTTMTASDSDPGTALTYSIVGGVDRFLFHLDSSTHALSFVTAPNFEAPTDSDHNNSYVVQIQASDGVLADTQTIIVTVTDVLEPFKPARDFNFDGHSDILWQNANGTPATWLMNGTSAAAFGPALANSGPAWHEKAAADFSGDGKADILWQNDNGTPAVWLMNGTNVAAFGPGLVNPGPAWHANAAADFNADGKADILWQNDNGTPAVWLMDGTGLAAAGPALANPGPAWHEKAAADFNGDGKADILWQNDNGTPAVWLMDGTNVAAFGPALANPGPAWHEKAAADFNGDHKADILWQNDNGTPAVWLMDGTNVAALGPGLANPGSDWHVI
jgi:hypothetical protein